MRSRHVERTGDRLKITQLVGVMAASPHSSPDSVESSFICTTHCWRAPPSTVEKLLTLFLQFIRCAASFVFVTPARVWTKGIRVSWSRKVPKMFTSMASSLNRANGEELTLILPRSLISVYFTSLRLSSFTYQFSSVQFSHSVVSNSLRPYETQHARPPCPSPTPRVHSNSYPSSRWYHPTISSSAVPFSSCPQSLPATGSFPMSQLFTRGGQSTGVSALASVLPVNTQDWSPSEWTSWISLQSKGLSRVFSNTTVQKHQFFGAQLFSQSNSHIHTWPLEKP